MRDFTDCREPVVLSVCKKNGDSVIAPAAV